MLTFKQKMVWFVLHIFWIIPINRRKIAFFSYGATKYSCNPKIISEYMHQNLNEDIELIWYYLDANAKDELPPYVKKIKKNSFEYFLSILTVGTVVTNVTFPRVTPFRKKQLLINTWHGTAFKGDNNSFGNNYNLATYMIAENKLTHEVYRKKDSFNYQGKILDIGMPRNDLLIKSDSAHRKEIREKLQIGNDEHIVLYAPTFRDSNRMDFLGIDFDMLVNSLTKRFGGRWKVLYRYHAKQINRIKYSSGIDVTNYPDMQDLLQVSDVLITDYSSCMWDFSLVERPVFLYAEDIEEYITRERGDFFFPFDKLPFPKAADNEKLSLAIDGFDHDEYLQNLHQYFIDFGRFNFKGDATEKTVAVIKKEGINR